MNAADGATTDTRGCPGGVCVSLVDSSTGADRLGTLSFGKGQAGRGWSSAEMPHGAVNTVWRVRARALVRASTVYGVACAESRALRGSGDVVHSC